jgi:hypothetical protein
MLDGCWIPGATSRASVGPCLLTYIPVTIAVHFTIRCFAHICPAETTQRRRKDDAKTTAHGMKRDVGAIVVAVSPRPPPNNALLASYRNSPPVHIFSLA